MTAVTRHLSLEKNTGALFQADVGIFGQHKNKNHQNLLNTLTFRCESSLKCI